ncbi:hypothetical protein [Lacisediminihabitans sp.]|jgi:hypothetical protein|uniref:hypothetical protein n=1 Tax=Lacisediminihabitans sp. TaxID=2787631 RepID=UPI002F933680
MQTPEVRKDALSGAITCVLGVLTLGVGVYFLILRPALLPEDIRYTGIDPNTLPPAFVDWLGIVFSTWGGFIAGFGITILGIGVFMLSGRAVWLYLGIAVGVLVAFGRFLLSNIMINSDSLWLIAALFVLALALSIVLLVKTVRRRQRKR